MRVYDTYNRALAALGRIFQVLDEEPPTWTTSPTPRRWGAIEGRVELEHVTFRYPPARSCCKDVSAIHAEPGETVALVGRAAARARPASSTSSRASTIPWRAGCWWTGTTCAT